MRQNHPIFAPICYLVQKEIKKWSLKFDDLEFKSVILAD